MWRPDFPLRLRSLVLAVAAAAALPLSAAVGVGDVFPALGEFSLEGAAPAGSATVRVIDFWASWCAPCKASFPAYARLDHDYRDRGLQVVAISVDEDAAAYAAFVRRLAPPFTVLRDARQALVARVSVPAMPTSFVVGRDGRVRFVHRGFRGPETEKLLREQVEALLQESPSSP